VPQFRIDSQEVPSLSHPITPKVRQSQQYPSSNTMPRNRRGKKDNDDDPVETSNSTSSSRNRKKSDLAVMQSSNQTDSERRALRHSQRELAKTVQTTEGIEDVDSGKFDEVRGKCNKLWDDVRYTREAVLDGDVLEMIATRSSRQSDKLVSVPRYDADRLVAKLRAKCGRQDSGGGGGIDWKVLGLEVGSCFNAMPSRVSFLSGPIQLAKDYRPKERQKPIRKKRDDDAVEEKPEDVHQRSKNKTDEDKLSAVERQMSTMKKALVKKCEHNKKRAFDNICHDHGVAHVDDLDRNTKKSVKRVRPDTTCGIKFLFNPKSFTQTVENIFNMSFMVKHGWAEVGVRSLEDCKALAVKGKESGDYDEDDPLRPMPGPYIKARNLKEDESRNRNDKVSRQSVLAFNMRDWKDMCESYGVVKGGLPHRGKSKHSRPAQSSPSRSQG